MSEQGIQISNSIKGKIKNNDNFKNNIVEILKQKSGGKCFLCKKPFNYASDLIHADHDTPEADGGETDEENLNLVHASCNKFKSANSTFQIKRFLPFKVFLENNTDVNFDKVSRDFFKIKCLLSGKMLLIV